MRSSRCAVEINRHASTSDNTQPYLALVKQSTVTALALGWQLHGPWALRPVHR